MRESTVMIQNRSRNCPQSRRAAGFVSGRLSSLAGTCVLLLVSAMALFIPAASAQTQVTCPPASQPLIKVPEIRSAGGKLKAELLLKDGLRTLWGSPGDPRCASQYMRFFTGRSLLTPSPVDPLFAGPAPIPGPTLRAHVGDLIEIEFDNHVNTQNFANSLDRGETGQTDGCDVTYTGNGKGGSQPAGQGDKMPNCVHGSSTTNVHFHGIHSTPNTTGDNVLLYIRPSLDPLPPKAQTALAEIFTNCEKHGPPTLWTQIPQYWRDWQAGLISHYDNTAPYQGKPGNLPPDMKLTPVNQTEIAAGLWPQYQMGWYSYCYRLPAYDPKVVKMGQAPGTHWYHAHKHGSTAINVANGMTGAFIIEGQYDADLRKYYASTPGWKLTEDVMVIQQLTTALNLTQPGGGPHSRSVPLLSVNGRETPVLQMQPNQIQLWRFVNGSERDATYFQNFTLQGASSSCSGNLATPCIHWRQIAQDGVQFNYENFQNTPVDNKLYLAPGNRADFLVQAPSTPGTYSLNVLGAICRNGCNPQAQVLLTVNVQGAAISPAMTYPPNAQDYPQFPPFLSDIPESEIFTHRKLVFQDASGTLEINGVQFNDKKINQAMLLNTEEEWKVMNLDATKEHPFHIHVNPFQITEVFQPQTANLTNPSGPCYVNPADPETWKSCNPPQQNFVWWDTFAIPASNSATLPSSVCTTQAQCPANIQQYTTCSNNQCTVTIPGYFKMRTRFVDFPGQFVLHCHILTHEDRGMMELIEVVPDTTLYSHH
ncbi:MAG: multicopper oxidase domain-containing protein [Acidobacteriia bacterium]|nr:multicopper oxidase domain-containing protein [Terriglobia bacterium]